MPVYQNVSAVVINIAGHAMGPGATHEIDADAVGLASMLSRGLLEKAGTGDAVEAGASQAEGECLDPVDAPPQDDGDRKAFLLDEIEQLSGKRPGANTGLDKLEAAYHELTMG